MNKLQKMFTLEMLHIINKPTHTRINFKADTDHQNFVYSSDRA